MLEELVGGTTDPEVLADLARGRLRKKRTALRQALAGRFRTHHGLLVSQIRAHLDFLDAAIDSLSAQIDTLLASFTAEMARLDTIPGVDKRTAEVLIAEIGVDMSVFPRPAISRAGPGCVPATTRVLASADRGRLGRATAGCEGP